MKFRFYLLFIIFLLSFNLSFPQKNLISITFWEKTGPPEPSVHPFTFDINAPQLVERIPDRTLNYRCDFIGWEEFYDVFFSDEKGNFNPKGKYITIEAVFNAHLPYGGGLNISEIELNFSDNSREFASEVECYRTLGDNAIEDSVWNAVDGNLNTCTYMGNTFGKKERLSLTVGFKSPLASK